MNAHNTNPRHPRVLDSEEVVETFESFISGLMGENTIIDRTPRPVPTERLCPTCRGEGRMPTGRFCLCPAGHNAKRNAYARKVAVASGQADRGADWAIENPTLHAFLVGAASWSSFAASMLEQTRTKKGLSLKQFAAVQSMCAKSAARDAARQTERRERQETAAKVIVDLAPIRRMFEAAAGNGYRSPKYRAEGLTISLASSNGSNPGALYVKSEAGDYMGKLIGTTFHPVRGGEVALPMLEAVAADPLSAAIRYGQKTGNCACCGRKLTNAESVKLGIGPICRQGWSL